MAAQAWLGEKYVLKCSAEVHSAEKVGTDSVEAKSDIYWTLETPADAKLNKPRKPLPVAIMEYKRKHLIDPKQLLKARYYQNEDARQFEKDAETDGGVNIYFTDTAFWLVKQAMTYQKRRNVRDVCLFDWDTIFILDFEDGFDPSKEDKDKGRSHQRLPAPKS